MRLSKWRGRGPGTASSTTCGGRFVARPTYYLHKGKAGPWSGSGCIHAWACIRQHTVAHELLSIQRLVACLPVTLPNGRTGHTYRVALHAEDLSLVPIGSLRHARYDVVPCVACKRLWQEVGTWHVCLGWCRARHGRGLCTGMLGEQGLARTAGEGLRTGGP